MILLFGSINLLLTFSGCELFQRDVISSPADFESYFSKPYLILDSTTLETNPAIFKLDENRFFYVRFNYENEIINRKIPFESNSLSLGYELFELDDGTLLDISKIQSAELFYYDMVNSKSEKMCTIKWVLKSYPQMKEYLLSFLENEEFDLYTIQTKTSYLFNILHYKEGIKVDKSALRSFLRTL
ncbi:MAG: hypothetical protein AAF620_17175 [Bacteroidota bacterium]